MKKHDEILELLAGFVLGELPQEQAGDVRKHLAGCDKCTVEVKRLRAVLDCAEQMKNKTVDETVFISAREKLIARVESGKGETLTNSKVRRRWIMQSKVAKWAVAAVIIVGVFVGFTMFGGTSSVAWAQVAERVEQVKTSAYHVYIEVRNIPGMDTEKATTMEQNIIESTEYGMRMDMRMGGESSSTIIYVLPADKIVLSIMPDQKKFVEMKLTDELLDQMRKDTYDPKMMIAGFVGDKYIELGRKVIDGIEVEGIESTDPKIGLGMFDDVVGRAWASVETSLPVLIEMEYAQADGMTFKLIMDGFQWDIALDASEFTPVIPDDYEKLADMKMPEMPEMNEKGAVKGLEVLGTIMDGKYPPKMNMMDILKTLNDRSMKEIEALVNTETETTKEVETSKTTDEYMDTMVEDHTAVMGLCMFYMQLIQEDKDPAYYGDRVTPADTDAVLMRWLNDEEGYRVIFGDLSIGDFSPEELGEMEAKLPPLPVE
ncbi:MAG: hypothetical protein FVQ79_09935 [Planctomycetes bacterium]|nr:hypothetical protein [Planctomycetota bacterium]